MADRKKLEVKFVGGGRYDLANLSKRKSGRARRSFRKRKNLSEENSRNFDGIDLVDENEDILMTNMMQENTTLPGVSGLCVGAVSSIGAYFSEVCRGKAVVPVALTFMAFAVLDFDVQKGMLKEDCFILVERSLHNFSNSLCWLYRCSCDSNRRNFLLSLNVFLQGTLEELNDRSQPCNHCQVVEMYLNSVETGDGAMPESFSGNDVHNTDHEYYNTDSIYELPCSKKIVCTFLRNEYSFVGSDKDGLKCFTCKYDTHHCAHVLYVQSKLDEDDEFFPFLSRVFSGQSLPRSPSVPLCVSSEKIKFYPESENLHLMRRNGIKSLFSIDQNDVFVIMPDAESTCCRSCSSPWSQECPKESGWMFPNIRLYLFDETITCNVFYRMCSNSSCGEKLHVDGHNIGILNMGRYLISHDVLRDYMYHFLYGSCTLQTYHQVWMHRLSDVGANEENRPSYNQLRYAWYSFLHLLDINFSTASTCSECGPVPDIVVCDATTVAFRKTMVLSHSDRVMISSAPCRKMLMKLANNINLSASQFNELVQKLSTSCHCVIPFLNWIKETYESILDCPPSIKNFIRAVAASSPVCGLIRPKVDIHSIVKELINGVDVFSTPEKVQLLQDDCPVVFSVLCDLSPPILPNLWRPMFEELLKKSLAPFPESDSQSSLSMSAASLHDSAESDLLCFFPNLPKCRPRTFYVADAARRKEEICSKKHPGHSFFLPGIFTLFCPHGFNYGFEVMQKRESPNVPFTIFLTRFEKAPRIIIYDNACNLHSYCLNRDPAYFKDTLFLVDRFHWKNHKGCSSGYNLRLYPQLALVNSQVNEQANSIIQRYRAQLSFMTQENFMKHCRFLLWFMNEKAARKQAATNA